MWASLISGGLQAIAGWRQSRRAKAALPAAEAARDAARPGTPKSVDQMVSRAERALMEGYPGMDNAQEQIRSTTAGNVGSIREGAMSSTELIGGVTGAYRQELDSMNKLATQEAMYRAGQEQNVQGALGVRGQYEDRASGYKYAEASQELGELKGAYTEGVQNIWGGVQTGIAGVQQKINQAEGMLIQAASGGMFGGGGGQPTGAAPMQSIYSMDKSIADMQWERTQQKFNNLIYTPIR